MLFKIAPDRSIQAFQHSFDIQLKIRLNLILMVINNFLALIFLSSASYQIAKDFSDMIPVKHPNLELLEAIQKKEHEKELEDEKKRQEERLEAYQKIQEERQNWKSVLEKSQVVELIRRDKRIEYVHHWTEFHKKLIQTKKDCLERIMAVNKGFLSSKITFEMRNKVIDSCHLAVRKLNKKWENERTRLVNEFADKDKLAKYENIKLLRNQYEELMDKERKTRRLLDDEWQKAKPDITVIGGLRQELRKKLDEAMAIKLKEITFHQDAMMKELEEKKQLLPKTEDKLELERDIQSLQEGIEKLKRRNQAVLCNFKKSELDEVQVSIKWCNGKDNKQKCLEMNREEYLGQEKDRLDLELQTLCKDFKFELLELNDDFRAFKQKKEESNQPIRVKSEDEYIDDQIKAIRYKCKEKAEAFITQYRETCRGTFGEQFADFLECVLAGVGRMRNIQSSCEQAEHLDTLIERTKEEKERIKKAKEDQENQISQRHNQIANDPSKRPSDIRDNLVSNYEEYVKQIEEYKKYHKQKMKLLSDLNHSKDPDSYKKSFQEYKELNDFLIKNNLEAPPIPPAPQTIEKKDSRISSEESSASGSGWEVANTTGAQESA